MSGPALVLIAAVARNGVIGSRNALPWRLTGDMKHFRRATMGRPVLMGRKTWQSIGRPLPGRFVVVVSADPALTADGVDIRRTLEGALDHAAQIAQRDGVPEIMVAGGATLYEALIDRADAMLITEVALDPEGDAHFPKIAAADWAETGRECHAAGPGDEADYAFVTYRRRRSAFAGVAV